MNETINMIWVFTAGLALGSFFFGVLWLTVKKAVNAKRPALWILSSFFLRVSATLVGFYFIGSGNWVRLLIILFGFIIARFIIIHFTKLIDEKQMYVKKENSHGT